MAQTETNLKEYKGFKLFCMNLLCPVLKSMFMLETCATYSLSAISERGKSFQLQ